MMRSITLRLSSLVCTSALLWGGTLYVSAQQTTNGTAGPEIQKSLQPAGCCEAESRPTGFGQPNPGGSAPGLMQVSGPLKEARERAMHGDPDLAALLKEIQSKQGELEAKLLQKHPDVAKMMKDRDALMRRTRRFIPSSWT